MTRRLLIVPTLAAAIALGWLLASAAVEALPGLTGPVTSPPGPDRTATPANPAPTASAVPTRAPDPTPPSSGRRTGPTADPRIVVRLQGRLEELRVELGIPGVQATILFPDGTAWTGTSGVADIAADLPVTAETPFALASVSKSFTAAVVLQLVGEGVIGLDDPASAALPALGLDRRITIRMLLDHTSGLNDYLVSRTVDRELRAAQAIAWTAERALANVGRPYFAPGAGWHYSNTNYLVLGLLAEAVTGESLASLVRSRILDPLGLRSAFYQGVEDPQIPVARAYRFAEGPPGGAAIEWDDGTGIVPFTAVVTATAGAGSIAASSSDVAAFARAMWGGDLLADWVGREAIADAARVARMRYALPYGLGVQAYPVNGKAALGHSGRFSGARTIVRYLPGEDIAIAVLTNQSRIDPTVILSGLLGIASPTSRSGSGWYAD